MILLRINFVCDSKITSATANRSFGQAVKRVSTCSNPGIYVHTYILLVVVYIVVL